MCIRDSPYTCHSVSQLENNGQPVTTTDNHDDLLAHNQPIPRDRTVLKGTIDTSGESPGLGKFHRYVSWFLTTKPLDVKLIVSPVKYDTWLPEPGLDQEVFGSTMIVNLKIQNRDGTVPIIKAGSFELTLLNTSEEPGITLNMPKLNAGTKPDIKFI